MAQLHCFGVSLNSARDAASSAFQRKSERGQEAGS